MRKSRDEENGKLAKRKEIKEHRQKMDAKRSRDVTKKELKVIKKNKGMQKKKKDAC